MTEQSTIASFFRLWGESDEEVRKARLADVLTPDVFYADPHASGPVRSVEEMAVFLTAFTGNMPDAHAWAVEPIDLHHGHARATVKFARGDDVFATGQYFLEMSEDGRLRRIVGFMGKGPE